MLLLLTGLAHAGPAGSMGAQAGVSTAERTVAVEGRLRFEGGWQLGLRGEAADVTQGFVDGFAVDGLRLGSTFGLTVPIVRADRVQIDLEVDGGLQQLRPDRGTDLETSGLTLIADLSPMVTLPLGEGAAFRLGWKNVFHQQIVPSSALDAQGALVRAEGIFAVSPDLQLTIAGATGGVFGFGGDGGKYLAGVRAGVRFVPGAARTWKNH